MGLSLQQVSDRIEVEDLLERYTSCIDAKDWDKLDTVFAADAILDYSSSGRAARGSVSRDQGVAPASPGHLSDDATHDRQVTDHHRR